MSVHVYGSCLMLSHAHRAIASFAAEAERLRDEAMSLESTVQSREEGLDNLRAVNEALKAQLMSLGGSIGLEGGLGVEAVTRERRTLPVISPLPVGKSVRVADEDSKFENEAESPLVSSRSYQRDTSIEWQQGDQIGEGAYSKVFIGMNKVLDLCDYW